MFWRLMSREISAKFLKCRIWNFMYSAILILLKACNILKIFNLDVYLWWNYVSFLYILLVIELCPPKKICWNPSPQVPQNVALFGNRVTTDVVKIIRVGPRPIWLVSFDKGEIWVQTEANKENVMWDGVMLLQAKVYQRVSANQQELREGPGEILPHRPRSNQPCWHLGLGLLASRSVGE